MHSILSDKVAKILDGARQKRAIPGATVWLDDGAGKVLLHQAFGRTTYDDPGDFLAGKNMHRDMIYDVASVTKLITATAVLMSMEKHAISLDTAIAEFLPAFRNAPLRGITLRHLFLHTSGIEIPIQSLINEDSTNWIHLIANAPLHASPGQTVRYSCTNFFLLARIAELWNGVSIDKWISSHILQPLHMTRSSYEPQKYFSLEDIVPTEIDSTTEKPWHGVIHDEAARYWQQQTGTNSGNSGLFTTAADLAKFLDLWRHAGTLNGQKYFSSAITQEALRAQAEVDKFQWRGLGWQIDTRFFMSRKAPTGSAGHAGFTGSTIFFTPRGDRIIILENRVYPTRNGPERMPYHRRIAEALFDELDV